MKFLYSDGPIIACSTCTLAHAAMAVIRISGFKSLSQFAPFFKKDLTGPIEPRRVYYTQLVLQGQILDDLCFTYFEGPKSYNGENILELSVHGNTLNIERILELFIKEGGCKLASPGEFTYRALKNKKLTLSQVEGLDLFLNANSGYALDQGLSLLSGNLQEIYQELYELFIKHKSSLELSIDFAEDVGEEAAKKHFDESLNAFAKKFQSLVKRVQPMDHNLIQPEIVLAGLPNSGKSSLFNFLLLEERAIVSSVAGTTRDYLTETILIEGVKYKLIDTAGIRESLDLIEAEGIKRTKKKLRESFYSILLINPFEIVEGFEELLNNSFDLILFTHKDMSGFDDAQAELVAKYPQLGSIGAIDLKSLPQAWEKTLLDQVNKKYLSVIYGKPILLDRHKHLILQAHQVLSSYQALTQHESDVAILSQELNAMGHCISELIGIVSPDQILNSIFSNFCIGK
ncbi:MAG: 50S ribosome-binding GTPase [Bacteriovoracaceae bacterium]|nr:50S ribosome-binding GTPase [Bacteriovoracaceae bacterium]